MGRILILNLDAEFFDAIACGSKLREYREVKEYWRKRLAHTDYTEVHIAKGYPKAGDRSRFIPCRWAGFKEENITHAKFGGVPKDVYAIDVTQFLPRVYVHEPVEIPDAMIRDPRVKRLGNMWSHLWCDPGAEDELHRIAKAIGMRREWFQDRSLPHYDLVPSRRIKALAAGAVDWSLEVWMRRRIAYRKAGIYKEFGV